MSKETYQMEPRNVRGNTFQRGISQLEHYGTNPMENTGVPLQGFKGVPVVDDTVTMGVAMPGSDYKRDPQVPVCSALTKKGEPCKAAPTQATGLCVGHTRALKSDQDRA